jgi:hypothetical protein
LGDLVEIVQRDPFEHFLCMKQLALHQVLKFRWFLTVAAEGGKPNGHGEHGQDQADLLHRYTS